MSILCVWLDVDVPKNRSVSGPRDHGTAACSAGCRRVIRATPETRTCTSTPAISLSYTRPMSEIKFGALCWNQYTEWDALLEAGVRADRLGYGSLWTWG